MTPHTACSQMPAWSGSQSPWTYAGTGSSPCHVAYGVQSITSSSPSKQLRVQAPRACRCCTQLDCVVPMDEPIFQPFPPEVMFSGYDAFKQYEATLYLRNNDKVRALQPHPLTPGAAVHVPCRPPCMAGHAMP